MKHIPAEGFLREGLVVVDQPGDGSPGSLLLQVACSGERHGIVLVGGGISFLDHDLAAEDVLDGLGGPQATCMVVRRLRDSLDFDHPVHRAALMQEDTEFREMLKVLRSGLRSGRLGRLVRPQGNRYQSSTADDGQGIEAVELLETLDALPEPMRTGVRVAAATEWFDDQQQPAQLKLKLHAAQAFTSVAPGSIDVHCFIVPPHWRPGVSAWTNGQSGVAGLFLRPHWMGKIAVPGCAVVDGHFVVKAHGEPYDSNPPYALGIRWTRRNKEWYASAAPVWLDRNDSGWSLSWIR